jgi:hypothetical protein
VLSPLIAAADEHREFGYKNTRSWPGLYGLVGHPQFVAMLKQLLWLPEDHFAADLRWFEQLEPDQIEDWAVVLPQHVGTGPRAAFGGYGPLSVFRRRRRRGPLFGAISDPKHRPAADRIAGVGDLDDDSATNLYRERRGAVLVYPVVELDEDGVPAEFDEDQVVVALSFVAPTSTGAPDGRLIQFEVRDRLRSEEPIVDAEDTDG